MGPNCMGGFCVTSGWYATFTTSFDHYGGNGWSKPASKPSKKGGGKGPGKGPDKGPDGGAKGSKEPVLAD